MNEQGTSAQDRGDRPGRGPGWGHRVFQGPILPTTPLSPLMAFVAYQELGTSGLPNVSWLSSLQDTGESTQLPAHDSSVPPLAAPNGLLGHARGPAREGAVSGTQAAAAAWFHLPCAGLQGLNQQESLLSRAGGCEQGLEPGSRRTFPTCRRPWWAWASLGTWHRSPSLCLLPHVAIFPCIFTLSSSEVISHMGLRATPLQNDLIFPNYIQDYHVPHQVHVLGTGASMGAWFNL